MPRQLHQNQKESERRSLLSAPQGGSRSRRGPAMGCQGRKITKQSLHPPVKGSSRQGTDYSALKRAQLQQQCKKLGLRATGKNAELVERLKAYHEELKVKTESDVAEAINRTEASLIVPPLDQIKNVKTSPSEEKTDNVLGWCVVHGMALYRPQSSWAPLLLRGGLVCVQDGENLVPFQLLPLNIPVPDDLSDNHVCQDCVLRTVEIRKLYQPQEDQAYAQRVDGILSQMARGELGMDRALRPLQPLVVHSPAPFDR